MLSPVDSSRYKTAPTQVNELGILERFANTIMQGFLQFQQEIAALPMPVLIWMWAMRVVFVSAILFLPRRGAIAVLATMIVTAFARFYIKGAFPSIPAPLIGAGSHAVLWFPLFAFLLWMMRPERARQAHWRDSVYAYWYVLVMVMIAVSLAFDIREIARAIT